MFVQSPKFLPVRVWRILGTPRNDEKFEYLEVKNGGKELKEVREELDECGYFNSKNKPFDRDRGVTFLERESILEEAITGKYI